MITIDFDKRGSAGLCEFLVDSLKTQILTNRLIAGEKLPSKRTLASHLGVSVITVQNAYNELIATGYIYSIEKKGFFVTEIMPVQSFATSDSHEATKKAGHAHALGNTKPEPKFFTDFRSNSTLSEKFPFNVWAKISRQVLNRADDALLERQDVFGVWELREAIAKYLLEFRNMQVRPEQILIAAGTESLYSMLVQFLGRTLRYALENPGYKKVASVFKLEGARVTALPIDSEGMNPELLKRAGADVVHLSPSHHFPTGIVTPIRRRNQLLNWASEKPHRYIIEDDYDSEFRFNGKPLQTLQSGDKFGRVIYINTFSKTLAPSFRISYMVLPANLVEPFRKKFEFASCQVSAFEQFTLAQFISQGYYSKHIIRMKNYYRTLRNNLIQAFTQSKFKDMATIREEEAGLHFLLTLKADEHPSLKKRTNESRSGLGNRIQNGATLNAEILDARLRREGIRLPLLRDYFYETTKHSETTFVVNYSGIKKERIVQTVKRMEKAILGG